MKESYYTILNVVLKNIFTTSLFEISRFQLTIIELKAIISAGSKSFCLWGDKYTVHSIQNF